MESSHSLAKTFLYCIFLIIVPSCTAVRLSDNGVEEKAFIEKFLRCMLVDDKAGKGIDYKGMMDCISPKYIKTNKIDKTKFKVNNYSVSNFSIEDYNRKYGIITVKIWGVEKKWIHRIEFNIVKEKGVLYLFPSKHSDKYIDPWKSVSAYIKE